MLTVGAQVSIGRRGGLNVPELREGMTNGREIPPKFMCMFHPMSTALVIYHNQGKANRPFLAFRCSALWSQKLDFDQAPGVAAGFRLGVRVIRTPTPEIGTV